MSKKTYAFVIEPSEHAELSASSADRWSTCVGSPALIKGLPNHATEYSAGGSAAHWVAAECQRHPGLVKTADWLGKWALVEGFEVELDEELLEAVADFLAYLRDNEEPEDVVLIEQSFTPAMKKLHPKFGGSTDRIIWRQRSRLLRVYDYKHGAGVPVDVDDNKQLKYYALGALLSNRQWDAEDVELVIAQPRCDHEQGRIRTYKMKAFELVDFAGELIEAAKRTEEFGADLVPSTKACKFCPAMKAKKCPAVDKQNHALIAATFDVIHPSSYNKEQIAEFLEKAPLVEAQISAIREFAYQESLRGEGFPGWKIVEKRATRKWADEEAVKNAVGATPEYFKPPKYKSPKQIEDMVGKKEFKKFEALVVKESSGMTLVPASDPRAPAQVALLEHFPDVSGVDSSAG